MADKEYQTEGAMEMAASIKPMSEGYYLVTAEDVLVPGDKSLADYINEGGGGNSGGGNGGGVVIDTQETTWLFNDTIDATAIPTSGFDFSFTSDGAMYKEIKASTVAGVLVVLYMSATGSTSYIAYRSDSGWMNQAHKKITIHTSIADIVIWNWLITNATLMLKDSTEGLPSYTEDDNGKFLQLVDGSPAWVLIEDGNGVRY